MRDGNYARRASKYQPVLQTIRQIGIGDTCWYALSVLLIRLSWGRWRLYKYRMTAQPVATPSLGCGRSKTIAVFDVPDADLHSKQFDRPAEVLRQRYHHQRALPRRLPARPDARLPVADVRPYQEDYVRARFVPVGADMAWDFDVQVFPAHQLGSAFPRLLYEANSLMHARGVQWTCSRGYCRSMPPRARHMHASARASLAAPFSSPAHAGSGA